MKKLALALCIVMVSIAGSAFALQWENNLGMYFDEEGSNFCDALPMGYHVNVAHLVLTNLTADSVAGWEVKITTSSNLTKGQFVLRGDAINAASRVDEYIVGLGTPLTGDAIVLADFDLYLMDDTTPAFVYLDGVYFHSLDNRVPAYADGNSDIIEIHQSTGGANDPVMIINGECVVANEEASWDSVKSLYR